MLQEQVEESCLSDSIPLLTCYFHVQSRASTNTCHCTNLSSFITPQPPLLPSLSMSVWWLRQQPSALRYNQFSSPPGRRKKWGIHQNCADSALSVLGFFITHRCCSPARTDSWMLQGVRGKANVYGSNGYLPCLFVSVIHQRLFMSVIASTWLIFQLGRCCILCICVNRLLCEHIHIHPHARMLLL